MSLHRGSARQLYLTEPQQQKTLLPPSRNVPCFSSQVYIDPTENADGNAERRSLLLRCELDLLCSTWFLWEGESNLFVLCSWLVCGAAGERRAGLCPVRMWVRRWGKKNRPMFFFLYWNFVFGFYLFAAKPWLWRQWKWCPQGGFQGWAFREKKVRRGLRVQFLRKPLF